LSQKILKRHYDFVKKYEDNMNELESNLDAVERAVTPEEAEPAIKKALEHLNKLKPPVRHKPIDPDNLLNKTIGPVFKEPRIGKGGLKGGDQPVLLASNGTLEGLLNAEGTNDLAETVEVQFTPAITDKAGELENNPVRIYNWVRNNIDFVPTYGSIQGADMCLQTKQCNAFDTASLLIALLRVSNISARYVEGTVEIPIEKVMNWVGGFTDEIAALNLIVSGGIPVTGLQIGGQIVMVRMEHVWVEAYVDYVPYRGAVNGEGDAWIPLDASYKQYNYFDGLDADSAVPTDFEALLSEVGSMSSINGDVPSITGMPPETIHDHVTDYQTRLRDYMNVNFPETDNYYELRDTLHGYKEIIKKEMRFLPNSLAGMKVIAGLDTFSEIPQVLRHTVKINAGSFMDDDPLTYSASLPEIAGRRVTLSYAPATSDDAMVMEDSEGILDFPLYLVEVIPELKIEGLVVASGQRIVMGSEQSFRVSFRNPDGSTDIVKSLVLAGEYHAVGIDVNKVNFQYLYDRTNGWQPDTAVNRDDRLGELLHLTSMFYFARADYFNNELARSGGIISLRQPSACNVSMKLNVNYVFGTPLTVSSVGLNMDVVHDVISLASRDNNKDKKVSYMIQTGLYSSGLEHFLFEYIMDFESVSAIKLLGLANQQNIPIYIIDLANSQRVDELNISSYDKQDIRNLINAGRTVLVPQSEVQHVNYSGIGYMALDLQTGAGAYLISGGYNGGDTTCDGVTDCVDKLLDLADELLGDYKFYGTGYKVAIRYMLKMYPDISNSPDVKFEEWAENILFLFDTASQLQIDFNGTVNTIIGQQILYYTMIMLLELVT
jgi:hypothetical protein